MVTLIIFLEWFVKNVDEDKPRQFSSAKLPNWRLYGTAMFLIADLLNCPYKNNYFICKNVPFLRVLFWGTVVSASIYFDRYSIVGKINIHMMILNLIVDI